MPGIQHFSDFGGLWTDRVDALDELERRASGLEEIESDRLRSFIENGYVVLERAVPEKIVDTLRSDIDRAWKHGDDHLFMFPPGTQSPQPLRTGTPTERARVVDIYVHYESARRVLFSNVISSFLRLLFERPPMLFQSLSFEKGSQQGMHQDTAYVVCSEPLHLAASWIALEDVSPGSGELMYYEGSHRLPEYKFSGAYKHWSPERDGSEQHTEWAMLINQNAERLGMPRRTFLPRKGDALIWAADLAHGGSPVQNPEATRKSLVGHYTPHGVEPNYFAYRDDRRTIIEYGPGLYSSEHYDCSRPLESVELAETPLGLRSRLRERFAARKS